MKKWHLATLAIGGQLLVVVLAVCIGVGLLLNTVARSFQPDTSPRTYASNLGQWQSTGLVGHFPDTIPAHATDVRFSEQPGFMQSSPQIQLYLVLPAHEVRALIRSLTQQATHIYPGGGEKFLHLDEPDGVPTAVYWTAPPASPPATGVVSYTFPPDFTFYVLPPGGPHNAANSSRHKGQSCGVAINPVTNEVVYWAEMWDG